MERKFSLSTGFELFEFGQKTENPPNFILNGNEAEIVQKAIRNTCAQFAKKYSIENNTDIRDELAFLTDKYLYRTKGWIPE